MFEIGKPVLVFETRMGKMPGELRFRWTRPYWITREFNGSYQLGTLAGEVLGKWVNGFRLKPYGPMPRNPFEQTKVDTELDTGKPYKTTTGLAISKHIAGKRDHKPANGKNNATKNSQAAGKVHNSDRALVGPDAN